MKKQSPPGMTLMQLLRELPAIRRDVLTTHLRWHRTYGDVIRIPFRPATYMIAHPEDIKHVLLTNSDNYRKVGKFIRDNRIVGKGLFSSEEPLHMRQRRIIHPMFHHEQLASYSTAIAETTEEYVSSWKDGDIVEMSSEMMRLTLTIVGKTLFSIDLFKESANLTNAWTTCQHEITKFQKYPFFNLLPEAVKFRFGRALRELNDAINELIATRRAARERPPDLLSLLLESRYEDGTEISTQLIRDEVMTFLIAGHETTGNSIAWILWLLSQHPEAERAVREESDAANSTTTNPADLISRFPYLRMVSAESLRLYPGAWNIARQAVSDDVLPGGTRIPAASVISMIQYVCHRNPKYFPDPERFDPSRFDVRKQIVPFSYFPFGGGPRHCIGEQFAKMEMTMIVAELFRKFELTLVPGQVIEPEPLITLRPKNGVYMRVSRRGIIGRNTALSGRQGAEPESLEKLEHAGR